MNLTKFNGRRVVVTGYGLVTSFGDNPDYIWSQLISGKSAIGPITRFDASELGCQIAGEIKCGTSPGEINTEEYIKEYGPYLKKMDNFILWGLIAAIQAMKHSGLEKYLWKIKLDYEAPSCKQKYRIPYNELIELCGVITGSGIGGIDLIERTVLEMAERTSENLKSGYKKNPLRNPYFIVGSLINTISGFVSQKYGLKGPNQSAVTACATGAHAIADGARLIATGEAEIMLVGGSEAAICKTAIAGFDVMKALSTRNDSPEKASSPWDKKRDGFVMGEGAGIMILEEYQHAMDRGAKIHAELIGYGTTGDAYHMSAPHPEGDGGMRAMKMAIKNSGIEVGCLDYMNAHGTSTPLGDIIELRAVKKLYENDPDSLKNLSISSTKSSIGHLLGAAGAVEAIFTVMAIERGEIPPTINLSEPSNFTDSDDMKVTDLFDLVPNVAKKKDIRFAMSNSFGFGGTNATLLFGKLEDKR